MTFQTDLGKVFNSVVRSVCPSSHMVSMTGIEKDLQQSARDVASLALSSTRWLVMRRRISSKSNMWCMCGEDRGVRDHKKTVFRAILIRPPRPWKALSRHGRPAWTYAMSITPGLESAGSGSTRLFWNLYNLLSDVWRQLSSMLEQDRRFSS